MAKVTFEPGGLINHLDGNKGEQYDAFHGDLTTQENSSVTTMLSSINQNALHMQSSNGDSDSGKHTLLSRLVSTSIDAFLNSTEPGEGNVPHDTTIIPSMSTTMKLTLGCTGALISIVVFLGLMYLFLRYNRIGKCI